MDLIFEIQSFTFWNRVRSAKTRENLLPNTENSCARILWAPGRYRPPTVSYAEFSVWAAQN